MSQCSIDWLRESLRNHSDGTFQTAPKFFFQFYVFFGQKNDMILPCVYAAMPNKTTETYIEVIDAIKLIVKPLADPITTLAYKPEVALTDFEPAIMKAFLHCFPSICIKGCYFFVKL